MAYESKLYIVDKSRMSLPEDLGRVWAQTVVCYDAGYCSAIRAIFTQPTTCYIYADDGDTKILIDEYGKPLTEASVESVIRCIEGMSEKDLNHRRIPPLFALLKAFDENKERWQSLAVLHYGY